MPGAMKLLTRRCLTWASVVAVLAAMGSAASAMAASSITLTKVGSSYASMATTNCGSNLCTRVVMGRESTDDLYKASKSSCTIFTEQATIKLNPALLQSVTLQYVLMDDYVQLSATGGASAGIIYTATASWTGPTYPSSTCETKKNTTVSPNSNVMGFFNTANPVTLTQRTAVGGDGNGYSVFNFVERKPQCSDGIDNDSDGKIDYPNDPGCYSADDDDERDMPACNDGVDNDGDGKIDYPNDPGCSSANDKTETFDTVAGTPCPGCTCGADLNGNGYTGDFGETTACSQLSDGTAQCPLQATACTARDGGYVCPLNPSLACQDTGGATPTCSANQCYNSTTGSQTNTDINQPPPTNDGPKAADGSCLGVLRLFPGQGMRCRKSGTQTAFQNCCHNDAGKLADTMGEEGGKTQTAYKTEANSFLVWKNQCDIQDQQSAQLADSSYCIDLGEYCAEKWIFGCVQKAEAYCCFNSKLSRIIQEQGRPQIPSMGGFGSKTNPNCRGFTIEEFQALDFSKIDMSSYYADFRMDSQSMIMTNAQDNAHANTGK